MENQAAPTEEEVAKRKRNTEILGRMTGSPNAEVVDTPRRARPKPDAPESINDLQRIAQQQKESREGWWFQLPEDCLGTDWDEAGRDESEQWFKIIQVKPREQSRAMKIGKENAEAVGTEMIFQALWAVGATLSFTGEGEESEVVFTGWYVRNNRDQAKAWWSAIGPQGRALVQDAFMDRHQPSEAQRATFLAGSRRG